MALPGVRGLCSWKVERNTKFIGRRLLKERDAMMSLSDLVLQLPYFKTAYIMVKEDHKSIRHAGSFGQ